VDAYPKPAETNLSVLKLNIPKIKKVESVRRRTLDFWKVFFMEDEGKLRSEAVIPPASGKESHGIMPQEETSRRIFSRIVFISNDTGNNLEDSLAIV